MKKIIVILILAAAAFVFTKHHRSLKNEMDKINSSDWSLGRTTQGPESGKSVTNTGASIVSTSMAEKKDSKGANDGPAGGVKHNESQNEVKKPNASAQRSVSSINPRLDEFFKAYPGDWSVIKRENGQVGTLVGGPGPKLKAEKNAVLELARDMAVIFDIDPTQIDDKVIFGVATKFDQKFLVNQSIDGVLVYGGNISFLARPSDDTVQYIDNQLIEIASVDENISISEASAKALVPQHLASAEATVASSLGKMIMAPLDGVGPAFFVWGFRAYKAAGSGDAYEVVIDARDGKLVLKRKTSFH